MKIPYTITVKNKKHPYFIQQKKVEGEEMFFFECKGAGITQHFYPEDLAQLLVDLPQWISEYQHEQKTKKASTILFRVKLDEKMEIEKKAHESGYSNISRFIRDKVLA